MEARVKEDYRFKNVMAFAGQSYVKGEWRSVPANAIEEATRRMNDEGEALLEFRQTAAEKRAVNAEKAEEKAAKTPVPARTPTPRPAVKPPATPATPAIIHPAPTAPPKATEKGK